MLDIYKDFYFFKSIIMESNSLYYDKNIYFGSGENFTSQSKVQICHIRSDLNHNL